MSIKPGDYDVPGNYRHWPGDTAEDAIGPFFFRMEGEHPRSAFRAGPQHCNAHGTVHGGILMTLADYTLCLGANGGEQQYVATVSCNNEFIAPARQGDLILGQGEVMRRGKSLVFVRCDLRVEEQIILSSSAVIKLLRR
jgi:uncharacterized protein (TIGR00369 family)